ncbi:DUF6318 family protein [Arthrobacter sp. NPDC057009]|uniref:DUF6318 family protein n=1 Tax=Arthrobacter sp. NPDC057009 TaxID=3345996 RepID=UPI003624D267
MTSRTCFSERLRLSVFSAVAVSVLALTSCSGGGDPQAGPTASAVASPAQSTPGSASATPSATPTPKPTPVYKPADAKGRAQNVPVPVKPPLADKNTKEGLEAFTKYWYELMGYAYETGDLKPVDAVTAATCASCVRVRPTILSWNSDGRWIEGGAFEIFDASTKFRPDANGNQQVFVQYHRLATSYREPNGAIKQSFKRSNLLADIFLAKYRDDGWFVRNVDRVGG